jgi:zona occludens toxin (predicted ATPase)
MWTDQKIALVLVLVLLLDFHRLWRHAAWHEDFAAFCKKDPAKTTGASPPREKIS